MQGKSRRHTAPVGDTRAHKALAVWPEVALAYAAGGPAESLPDWAHELFAAWDPAALHSAALQRIRWTYGPDAASAAADLASRGSRADLDTLALGLGWRVVASPERGLRAAAGVAAAALDRRDRLRRARVMGVLLLAWGAVALWGALAGSGDAPALGAASFPVTVGVALGAVAAALLNRHLNRRDLADGGRWGALLRDLTRPPSDAEHRWQELTTAGSILDRLRAAWAESRAVLAARTRTRHPARTTALRGARGRGAPPVTGPPTSPWVNLTGSPCGTLTVT